MAFNTSSIWIKVALICLLLATVLFVIGFATVSWMVFEGRGYATSSHYGLWKWKYCDSRKCNSASIRSRDLEARDWEDWYRATQALECMGLICLVMATFIMVLFVFVDRMRKRSPLLAIIAFSFAAVVFMVIGFIVFATQFEEHTFYSNVGWSMGVAIAASILAFIAGVMAVIDLKK